MNYLDEEIAKLNESINKVHSEMSEKNLEIEKLK